MLIEVIAIILALVYLGVSSGGAAAGYRWLVDMPSLVGILILTLPLLFRNGMWREFVTAIKLLKKEFSCSLSELKKAQSAVQLLQKQLLCAGAALFVFYLIYILFNEEDTSQIGLHIACSLIGVLYAVLLELLLLPLESEIKRRIVDYMEEA